MDRHREFDEEEWTVNTVGNNDGGYRQRPCSECPFRTDAPTGRFPPEVFATSRATAVQPDAWAPDGRGTVQHQFGCHMSAPSAGAPAVKTCAGFLAVSGHQNWSVRLSVHTGRISADMLSPGHDWPELYETYDDMCRANGYDPDKDPDA